MKPCITCNSYYHYNERFDSYYCPRCNEWKEKKCSDKDCFYCNERPEMPSDYLFDVLNQQVQKLELYDN